jgi:type II secretory pathway pseudopilin PulG
MAARGRPGFTLVEMVVAVTLTLAVFAITIPFVRAQSRALGANAGRLEAEQIARFAQRAIDQELRAAAGDSGQPVLVQAGGMSISFNANVLASDNSDPVALGVESGAATTLTMSWRLADAGVLPRTTVTYPTRDYTAADGGVSRVETIHYFLHPDTISGRQDVYVLYRRVNARDSVTVVRGVYVPVGQTFFTYQRLVNGVLTDIPAADLPLLWTNATIDDVRTVVIRSGGFFRNRQTNVDLVRTASWVSALPSRVREVAAACSGVPRPVTGLTAVKQAPATRSNSGSDVFKVDVSWSRSADDPALSGNATDLTRKARRYVLERRVGAGPWVGVGTVSAAGFASYTWTDYVTSLTAGTYQYAIRVVGCSGELSTQTVGTPSITLP